MWFLPWLLVHCIVSHCGKIIIDNCCSLGDTTCGQRAIYEIGMTGIPIYNVRYYDASFWWGNVATVVIVFHISSYT